MRDSAHVRAGLRQGFLSNITNPKVLVFYLAVLPQFIGSRTPLVVLLVFGLTHALLSLGYLLIVVTGLDRIRGVLTRRRVRRALDAATGTALLGSAPAWPRRPPSRVGRPPRARARSAGGT